MSIAPPLAERCHQADTYIVIEESPDGTGPHERTSGGLNHLALFGGSPSEVDTITEAAAGHGWTVLFSDKHPHAGGPDHYASYMENSDGFEVELVADDPSTIGTAGLGEPSDISGGQG